jgi:hypothetical protein
VRERSDHLQPTRPDAAEPGNPRAAPTRRNLFATAVRLVLPFPGVLACVSALGIWATGLVGTLSIVITLALVTLAFSGRGGVHGGARHLRSVDRCAAGLAIALAVWVYAYRGEGLTLRIENVEIEPSASR